jgi:hypothetical protein
MKKRPSLYGVLEGFLNRECWAEQSLRDASLASGGSSVDNNTNRSMAAHQRKEARPEGLVRGLLQHAALHLLGFHCQFFQ